MSIHYRVVEKRDCEQLRSLFADCPQEGGVEICFEREPNFFLGQAVAVQEPLGIVAEEKVAEEKVAEGKAEESAQHHNKIVAYASFGTRPVFVNGQKQSLLYASDLRIHPLYRKGRLLFRLYREAYKRVSKEVWGQTAIFSENAQSINNIASGRKGLPSYFPDGTLVSHLIYVTKVPSLRLLSKKFVRKKQVKLRVKIADATDIVAMQSFFDREAPNKQYYPVYSFSELGSDNPYYFAQELQNYFLAYRGDRLVGMLGLWDQKQFKQTCFTHYSGIYKLLRKLYNFASLIKGGLQLPKAGGQLNYQSVHTVLLENNSKEIFAQLMDALYSHCLREKVPAVMCGLMEKDPLLKVLKNYPCRLNKTDHYLVTFGDYDPRDLVDDRIPYLESVRL